MDKKIEKAVSKLLEMYEKIENDLLIEIASHFSINDEFLNSDHWRLKKLEEMGLFNQDIINYLSRETKKTDAEIKNALNQIGIDTINLDNLNRLFEDEVLKINPNILSSNGVIDNIIKTAYDELSSTLIQMSHKIEKSTVDAYLDIVESAYLKTTMGTHSYHQAIRESINELSNEGINILTYKTIDENGVAIGIRNYDIEGAVRREVLTAGRKLNNAIALETANELECEYLYLSEHLQCRPNHFEWQGTIIKREDLIDITHYGEVDGLAGINCRHYFEPYFGNARNDELKNYSQEQCTNAYNLSQKQRYLERGIKKWKRKAEMFKAADDLDLYAKSKEKISEWQNRTERFTEKYDLKRDYTREYVKSKDNDYLQSQYRELVREANLKYNIGTREENIKRCIKAREIQQKIKSDEVNKLIIESKQVKHLKENKKSSYFYINLEECQSLVNKHSGTGIIKFDRHGKWNNKEIINTDKIIGKYINNNYETITDTNSFVIHYSKKGVHIVPANKEGNVDK